MTNYRVFVQARISSGRFPAKVLAPFRGKPIVSHVIERISEVVPPKAIVVATSADASDDPLAAYLREMGVTVFRGPLEDVFTRYRLCLEKYSCDWFFRVCADSPLLNSNLIVQMLSLRSDETDLVTNVQLRTFPRGQSLELINAQTFANVDIAMLSADEKEHVTKVFYAHPDHYQIINIISSDSKLVEQSLAVDTIEDLRRLERLSPTGSCM